MSVPVPTFLDSHFPADAPGVAKCFSGDPEKGLVIFVSGVLFFGRAWGRNSVPEGLRRAGFEGMVVWWPWQERYWKFPTVGVLWDGDLQAKHAARIAASIASYREAYPDRPCHLVGCSAGGGLVAQVLAALAEITEDNPGAMLDNVALLGPALNPRTDLTGLVEKTVRGTLSNFCSRMDCVVLGVGTSIFGTVDRRFGASAGMVGMRHEMPGKCENVRFRPWMIRHNRFGGHKSNLNRKFIANLVAPRLFAEVEK
ncbi:MAG: hypothetical protein HN909_06295 [Phycisphaerales bacterium]|jgi:pimeloyl-ACP methyl ester carboxylesterase|nr:hypothetical protein [Phycisphaerales bacterium]MBT7171362.1 hypothetical protein [Phycisphaerales bacterium]